MTAITLFRVLDVETTGIPSEQEKHAVCEVGYCDVRLPLFKHKGKKWEDVPTDYLNWIVNKPNDVGADVKANAKLWLKKREVA